MKLRMIATALLLTIASAVISTQTNAAPWRGCWRGGFYGPRPVVRVGVGIPAPVIVPPAPIVAPPVVVGGYYGGCYGNAYYGHPYYHGGYAYRGGYGGGYHGGWHGRR